MLSQATNGPEFCCQRVTNGASLEEDDEPGPRGEPHTAESLFSPATLQMVLVCTGEFVKATLFFEVPYHHSLPTPPYTNELIPALPVRRIQIIEAIP